MASKIQKLSMHIGRLNHVAVAVPDMRAAMATWRDVLGAAVSEPEPQPDHGVYTSFVEVGDKKEAKIELITPLGDKSPIAGFLKKNAAGGMRAWAARLRPRLIRAVPPGRCGAAARQFRPAAASAAQL